ncbi:nickel transporter [Streptomyces sp. NBC_01264]|uniref:HoxN/HupN/NixA family nickel/cobalt transporter n=1 Tax=Streptomyces sp. NBC_01264 TaxID=2903804 RepID=UPI0022503F66|nr:nickel transporter [Streptomyces sp. NBC_01264]MCX4776620.1 nickel transporter [Streptomyces sp. NBC_01264]
MTPRNRRRPTAAPLAAVRLTPLAAALFTPLALIAAAHPAAAHPLGNFTVNYATHLTLRPHAVEAEIVVDRAEIAAAQERPLIDRDRDGIITAVERGGYADRACATLAGQLAADAGGMRVQWNRRAATLAFHPGEAGLETSRLTCRIQADADLVPPSTVRAVTHYDTRRIGWREITASGEGLTVTGSTVPAVSSTGGLRHYPQDPLAAPLDQRSAELRTAPGEGPAARIVPPGLPGAGPVTAVLDKVAALFDSLVGSRELTVPVGLLALLLAVVLGASHAALPGHGKTIMAAYLAGRRGTPRDAVTVGATVTLTHTAGVLTLGLVLPLATHLAGETVLAWLGLASGLLVTAIGLRLLQSALRGRGRQHGHGHHHGGHTHAHVHAGHRHDQGHGQTDEPAPTLPPSRRAPEATAADTTVLTRTAPPSGRHHHHHHDDTGHHRHDHDHDQEPAGRRRRVLIGVGIAGGLVPSPSALVVLLGAVALGRTAFGILLVIGYGLGMAATLTLAGLLLVRLGDRMAAHASGKASTWLTGLRRIGPATTSALVLIVGIGLTARAVTGL